MLQENKKVTVLILLLFNSGKEKTLLFYTVYYQWVFAQFLQYHSINVKS